MDNVDRIDYCANMRPSRYLNPKYFQSDQPPVRIFQTSIDSGDHSSLLGLRNEMTSPVLTLGSWTQIPLKAWMFVCIYSVFVLYCVGSGLASG
jgi:hypothetical protein